MNGPGAFATFNVTDAAYLRDIEKKASAPLIADGNKAKRPKSKRPKSKR